MQHRNNLIQFEFTGLKKIISGGQCGSDTGALVAAKRFNIETGGCAPKGWRTAHGSNPALADFGLIEHQSVDYSSRTQHNVYNSDGTLIIASFINSPGTVLTVKYCKKFKKPLHLIKLPINSILDIDDIVNFIRFNNIEVLNVAGNRDTLAGDRAMLHNKATQQILTCVLQELERLDLLIHTPNK